MSNMFDEEEMDPYDLLIHTVLQMQEMEKAIQMQQSQIARLTFLQNQIAANMKELTNYVTRQSDD